jgi:PE-PPE domain/PE family
MTFVTIQPQMAAAAADVAGIGSAIDATNAAAAGRTTGVVAAGVDEVSTATATLFNTYAQEYQAVLKQGTAFQDEFAHALTAAWSAYTEAEAANAAAIWGALNAPAAPNAAANVTLVMGGSGNPIPPQSYVNAVVTKYITPNFPAFTVANAQALFTPEAFYPLTGIKDLIPNVSVSEGVTILDNAIHQQLNAGNNVAVLGFSQSSIIASLEMMNLDPSGTPSSLPIVFSLLGDPMNPNGGLLARFPGLTMPSLGFTFYGATPGNDFPTKIYTIEYDGFADFPQYPINFLADLNAIAGIYYVHGTYADLTPGQLATAIPLTNTVGPTLTNYYMIPNPHLPLLEPLRAIPVVGTPVADLLEPDMRVLVNLGYGSPDQGWSTGPPNVPTSFGLFPPVNPGAVLGDLVTGTQQGIGAFVSDIGAAGSGLSPSGLTNALPSIALPPPSTPSVPSISGIVGSLQAANTSFTNAFSSALATGYSVLLPTADFANAAVTSIPSYDVNLFLNGILQAVNGDPVGLVNAVGYPIAADTALFTIAGGFEAVVLASAADSIVKDFASL